MSTFRNVIKNIVDKEAYFFIKEKPTKAKISNINDDLVWLEILEDGFGCTKLSIHIDHLILVTN